MDIDAVNTLGSASYAIAAAAFLGLGALVALASRRPAGQAWQRVWLLAACCASVIWALVVVLSLRRSISASLLPVAEALRDGLWLFFLSRLLSAAGADGWTRWLQHFAVALPAGWLLYIAWLWGSGSNAGIGPSLVFGGLVASLVGLGLVEQIYRNLRPDKRWAVKYLCLGLGGIFAYDLYLYSYTLLLHAIDVSLWDARGVVNALAVPLIAVAAARNPQWSAEVFVSRRVVFHTATLIGAGLYLLAMAGGGYYVREVGGTWGRFAQILFLAGAIGVLLVVLFSGQARARLRVALNKHFFTYKYDYREEWLRLVRQLYTDKMYSDPYRRAIVAVADIVESPGGAVWMQRGGDTYELAASHNFHVEPSASLEVGAPLAIFLRDRRWIVDVPEYADEPSRYDGLTLPPWLVGSQQAWLIVPLVQENALTGFIILARSRALKQLTWEDRDLLKAVGQQIGGFLAHHEDARALSEARQFEAYNRVTTFLMHDLKNIMAQQSLLVRNAARHKDNPAFVDDMVATIEHSVGRMGTLLQQLRRKASHVDSRESVNLADAVERAVQRLGERKPKPSVDIEDREICVQAEPDTLSMVVSHIVGNAQDATGPTGEVWVRVACRKGRAVVEVADNGCGMDADFVRDKLFEPFYTTKSSKGMGIGAYQAREFARGAGGDVEVESEPGHGTCFRLWLPNIEISRDNAMVGMA